MVFMELFKPSMMWTRAWLLVSLVTTCFVDGTTDFNEKDYAPHRSARSIFDNFREIIYLPDFFSYDYYYPHDNATEERLKLERENHTEEILENLQKNILEVKVSDILPVGLLEAVNSRPNGRSVGGIFSSFRSSLNEVLDHSLSWIILQGYSIMPHRMNAVMEYLESELQYWDEDSEHNVHRRDTTFQDNDFVKMMSIYQPDEVFTPKHVVNPTSSDPAECPNDTLWYTQCVKAMTTSYVASVMNRAGAALTHVRNYLDFE